MKNRRCGYLIYLHEGEPTTFINTKREYEKVGPQSMPVYKIAKAQNIFTLNIPDKFDNRF